jgi:hypothetical protein
MHEIVHLFVPAPRWKSRGRVKVKLSVRSVSLEAIERRSTVDIHRTLTLHASDDTAQSNRTKS